ncbi:MAG: phosphatidylserine/phosphatidylglycerophosphate/cardiolipin synthase family protein [Hyphomicrobiales bacterium]
MDPVVAFQSISKILQEQPDVNVKDEFLRWLGKVDALLQELEPLSAAEVSASRQVHLYRDPWAVKDTANAALYRALAKAEFSLPVESQGSFIAPGNALDAMAGVSRIMKTAEKNVLIVDPYMDDLMLTHYAVLASEGVLVELLSDERTVKPSFGPAVERFRVQFADKRPISARLSRPGSLHDRLVFLDGQVAYSITQSFKDLASRAHASIIRVDTELTAMKYNAYQALWLDGKVVA